MEFAGSVSDYDLRVAAVAIMAAIIGRDLRPASDAELAKKAAALYAAVVKQIEDGEE